MRERIDRFVSVIPSKEHVLQLVKKLDLDLKIESDSETFYLSFRKGKVVWSDYNFPAGNTVTISGRDAYLEQLLDGDLKLLQGVKMNYFTTDCPFRVLLILDSLFYLSKPIPA